MGAGRALRREGSLIKTVIEEDLVGKRCWSSGTKYTMGEVAEGIYGGKFVWTNGLNGRNPPEEEVKKDL